MTSSRIKIIIVDDDEDLCIALIDFIAQMGVQSNGRQCRRSQQKLQTEMVPFDPVLTDLRIPGGSWMDVLKAARGRNSDSLVPLTADTLRTQRNRALFSHCTSNLLALGCQHIDLSNSEASRPGWRR
jgi:DNA-binding NtrC family response regulator